MSHTKKTFTLEEQIACVLVQKHALVEANRIDGRIDSDEDLWEEIATLDAIVATLNGLRPDRANQVYPEPTCERCGCSGFDACMGGCMWHKLDETTNVGICSDCVPKKERRSS